MSQASNVRPAAKFRTQRMLDATMRSVLRSPLHRMLSSKMLIVKVQGREPGRVCANPVGYVESDGQLLIGTSADWELLKDEPQIVEP